MLRRLANLVLRWGLAGIIGTTSFFGSELHDIFGIHHAGQLGKCGCESKGLALQHGFSVAAVTAGNSENCDDGTNCPICNYLAQGQIAGEHFEGISVTVNVPNRSPAIPLFLPCPLLEPFQAQRLPLRSPSPLVRRSILVLRIAGCVVSRALA